MKHFPRTIAYCACFLALLALFLGISHGVLATTHIPSREFFYDIEVPEAGTVSAYEAMVALSRESDFSFKATSYPSLGYFVHEINGIKNADGFYWTLYINEKYSFIGVSSARIKPGDVIDWKYEKK